MYCRAITNMMQRYGFVDSASALNSVFTDSGLFGIFVDGPGGNSQDLLYLAITELHKLKHDIPDEELNRSKNILKMQILSTLERQEERMEELVKNYAIFGDITFHKYLENIDRVTSEQINRVKLSVNLS